MSVKDLRALVYDKLPEVDILKYEDEWLNPSLYFQSAIQSYWSFKYEIDADKILRSPPYIDKMKDLIRIIKSCRNLEQVTLVARHRDCTLTELRLLIKVICHRPLIKRLYLQTFCLYKEELLELGRCSMLEVLSIFVIVEDDDLRELFENCSKLKSLTLVESVFRPKCAESIPPLRGTCLMSLPDDMLVLKVEAYHYIETKYVLKALEGSRNLEVLSLEMSQLRNDDFMSDLEALVPFLKDLTLGPSIRVSNFGRFIHLKRLCLTNVAHVPNLERMGIVAENCSSLEDLTLQCVRPSMPGITVITRITNLSKLFLDGLFRHPVNFYSTRINFLSSCTKLEHLQIRNFHLINYDVIAIIESCHNLKYIDIGGCTNSTDVVLKVASALTRSQSTNGRTCPLKLKLSYKTVDHEYFQEMKKILEKFHPLLELIIPNRIS